MKAIDEALGSAIQKLTEQITSMGPDASRVYESMINATVLQGSYTAVIAFFGVIFAGGFAAYGKSKNDEELFTIGMILTIALSFGLILFGGLLLRMIFYPEAHIISRFLQ